MSVFVGRGPELTKLQARLDSTLQGQGGVVFITGDAGAGKSSLVERFMIDAALRAPGARVISAACSEQYGAGEPYQPFVEAFRDLLTAEKPGGAGKARLRDLAKELAPHWLAAIPVAGDIIAATAATAVELKETLGGGGTATVAAPSEEALFFQYTELLLAAAAETPVILFIDDLHWADRASVTLLGHIGRKIADQPVMILGTYRPVDVDVGKHPIKQAKLELERYGVAQELSLASLDSSALGELVEEELGGPAAPELRAWLERRAGTNPLFFVELLKWLVQSELVKERRGEWALVGRPEEIEIPRSAESAIEKRLSRLDPDVYRVLEYASVEGNEFGSVVLSRLLDMDELELEETLEPLARVHRLIRLEDTRDLPNGDLASIYEFSHSLFQDVLHKNLQGKRRILLHRKTAQILEDIYASDTDSIAHKLAVHFDEGRQSDRAYEFALKAAARASLFYAHWDAIELLERGLRNSGTDEQRLEALERLGDEHRAIGRYSEALGELNDALQLSEAASDRPRGLRLKRKRVLVERDFGNRPPEDLLQELEALAEEARALDARTELCEILWRFGGLPGASPEPAREALQIAEEAGEAGLVASAHYRLGDVLLFGENPGEAIPHLEQALAFDTEQDDTAQVGLCYNCLGIAHLLLGDNDRAIESFSAAATAFDKIKEPVKEASVRNNLGVLLTRAGDWERAETNLAEAVRLARRMDASARLLHPLENVGELASARGDREGAREAWEELLRVSQETGYWESEVVAQCGLGMLELEAGDADAAQKRLDRSCELIGEPEEWTECQGSCQLLAARLAVARGESEDAIRILEESEEQLAPRDRYVWTTFRLEHGQVLASSDPAGAAEVIQDALKAADQLGAAPLRARAETLLSELGGAS